MEVADLQVAVDFERRLKEQYQRYAVAVRTHLEHVASAAIKANDLAMQISEESVAQDAAKVRDHGGEEAVSKELSLPRVTEYREDTAAHFVEPPHSKGER